MSSPVPLELQQKIALWRQKAAEGSLTLDEMREAIKFLRAGRVASQLAAAQSSSKRRKAIAAIPSADDMLSDIMNS